jgi:type II secretory pathway component GspD/PulD (secretin)
MQVAYVKNLLTVQAEGADLAALLKKVGDAAGLPVEIGAGVMGTVELPAGDVH